MNKHSPAKLSEWKRHQEKVPLSMECLWEDELLEDNDGSVPGRPQYGQHHLHRLKPLLIQLPQQQNPFILCIEYLLISRALENCIKQQHHLTKKQLFIPGVSLRGRWEWTGRYHWVYLVDALIMIQTQTRLCESQQTKHLLVSKTTKCDAIPHQNMSELNTNMHKLWQVGGV